MNETKSRGLKGNKMKRSVEISGGEPFAVRKIEEVYNGKLKARMAPVGNFIVKLRQRQRGEEQGGKRYYRDFDEGRINVLTKQRIGGATCKVYTGDGTQKSGAS